MQSERTAIADVAPTTRSKVTNDPRFVPGLDGRSPSARRRRDLVTIYRNAIGGRASELQLVQIRKAAELTAAAESLRGRMLVGETIDLGTLVKLEGEARRAVRALGISQAPRKRPSLRGQLQAEAVG